MEKTAIGWCRKARHVSGCFLVGACLVAVFLPVAFGQSKDASAGSECGGATTVDGLGPEKAKLARAFLSELKSAVEQDQRSKVANMIRFPLKVGTPKKRFVIKDREEFLYNYDHILTAKVKAKIGDEMSSKCLFANWQGYMVGDGEVWFTEMTSGALKIISFNIDEDFSPQHPPKNSARSSTLPGWSCDRA
jgi:hypothetical protein